MNQIRVIIGTSAAAAAATRSVRFSRMVCRMSKTGCMLNEARLANVSSDWNWFVDVYESNFAHCTKPR